MLTGMSYVMVKPQRLLGERAKSLVLKRSSLENPAAFKAALPKILKHKFAYTISALEVFQTACQPRPVMAGNAVLEVLAELCDPPSGIYTLNLAINYALKMIEGDEHSRWAGLAALSVIPFPGDHPKLLQIGQILKFVIFGDRWTNVEAAAHTALVQKDILDQSSRCGIHTAAREVFEHYASLAVDPVVEKYLWNYPTIILQNLKDILDQFDDIPF